MRSRRRVVVMMMMMMMIRKRGGEGEFEEEKKGWSVVIATRYSVRKFSSRIFFLQNL
jgi:hypothetical protein